jgi:hypothetical protein
MTIKKRSTGAISADSTPKVGLGAAYAVLRRVDVVASADTSTAVTITDRDGVTVYTLASGDHTTKKRQYVTPVETTVVDTGGDAMIDAEGAPGGVIARSPLDVAITGIGSGTVTVDLFVDVDRLS